MILRLVHKLYDSYDYVHPYVETHEIIELPALNHMKNIEIRASVEEFMPCEILFYDNPQDWLPVIVKSFFQMYIWGKLNIYGLSS
jgi:hypothetical protein